MERLIQIRDRLASIIDPDFFMNDANVGAHFDNDLLAEAIRGSSYERISKRIGDFRARCEQQLGSAMGRVKQVEAEYQSLVDKANANEPGKPPSKIWLDKKDPNSVNKYNEKINRYNNQLEAYQRTCDQAARAKERLEDAKAAFEDKKADLEQQIQDREQELTPALDQDIVTAIGKLQKISYDSVNGTGSVFSGFLTTLVAKRASDYLMERIDAGDHRRTADQAMQEIDNALGSAVSNGSDEIKEGLRKPVLFLKRAMETNAGVLNGIEEKLKELPNETCTAEQPEAEKLVHANRDMSMDYHDIIDPAELAQMEDSVRKNKNLVESDIAAIDASVEKMTPVWQSVAEIKVTVEAELDKMEQYKRSEIDPVFHDIAFMISPFDPMQRDRYLHRQATWFEQAQQTIESDVGRSIPDLLSEITETGLLTGTASDLIKQSPAFGFLNYRDMLATKRNELQKTAEMRDKALAEINELPRQRAEELEKKMSTLLGVSLLPIGNLISAFSVLGQVKRFLPALSSSNSYFVDLRGKLVNKLRTFGVIGFALVVVAVIVSLLIDQRVRPVLWVCAGTYLVSSVILFLKASTLKSLMRLESPAETQ